MGFSSAFEMQEAWRSGAIWQQPIHKTGTPVLAGAGYWCDLSMAAGMPKYNAYVGAQNEFTPMVGTSNFGINSGGTGTKYLSRMMIGGSGVASTLFPANLILCDYVGFYPLVDMDATDYQTFDNTAVAPRYADGGLKLMVVCTTPQTTGLPILCALDYESESGRANTTIFYVQAATTGAINVTSANVAGSVATASPFVPLGPNDHSIRKVLGVAMGNSAGGFCAFVLVRPLVNLHVPEIVTPVEIDFPIHRHPIPEILSGAYLNFICSPVSAGTVSGIVRGQLDFIRSN